ncbi:MAG: hypothetical protein IPI67_23315 [Myxococcales bacterium]|nr:hypothetical protein [Myxococcales bacterium]
MQHHAWQPNFFPLGDLGTGTGTGSPCSFCGGSATLKVQWDNGTSEVSKLGTLTCAL